MPDFNLFDSMQLLRRMTPRRAVNALQVFGSFYASRILRRPVQWGLPVSIAIEPTTSCNLRCPECPSGLRSFTRPTGMLQEQLFKKAIDELHREVLYLIFYFQGEPYLNPNFLEMVEYAAKKKIYTATSTNAHYLDDERARRTVESGLNRLIISIDGTTQETYEQYRVGGSLEKVIAGTKKMVEWKRKLKSRTPHLIFQFLVVKPNEHQVEEVQQLATELGVNEVRLKTAQIYDFENGSDLIPDREEFARYKKGMDGKWKLKNRLLNHCWKLWHSSVITWDGGVVPCCFDKDAAHKLGSMQENTFREIWRSEPYRNFRASLLKSRKEIDICKNCTEGTKIWG